MADLLSFIQERHAVNPWVFLTLYVATIPPGWYAAWRIALAVRRRDRGALRPWALLLGAMVVIPYSYVLLVGRNLPWWIYPTLAAVIALSGCEILARVRKLARAETREPEQHSD